MNKLKLLVVLHETTTDIQTLLDLHEDPEFFASYHVIIRRDGCLINLVPPDMKAYAAADSKFLNNEGIIEEIEGSVDDFSYHIALESSKSAKGVHLGYTKQQYNSLAWLLKATGVEFNRIALHGELKDPPTDEPKCLIFDYLANLMQQKTNKKSIDFGLIIEV